MRLDAVRRGMRDIVAAICDAIVRKDLRDRCQRQDTSLNLGDAFRTIDKDTLDVSALNDFEVCRSVWRR